MKLYPHQVEGIEYLTRHKYVLLADEMGLGKSLQAIRTIENLPGLKLAVVPAYLRETWVAEIEKFSAMRPSIVKSKHFNDWSATDIAIVSYEGMKFIPEWVDIRAIIFDESQKIINPDTKRTNLAHDLIGSKMPEYMIMLSGTPITKSVGQFYAPLTFLSMNPRATNGARLPEDMTYLAFQDAYSNATRKSIPTRRGRRFITEYTGVKNLTELKGYFKGKFLRRTAEEVLDLPEIIGKEVILLPSLGNELEKAWQSHENGGGEHIATARKNSALAKVLDTVSYVEDMVALGEQVVIFSDHVLPVMEISGILNKKGVSAGFITGAVGEGERSELVRQFQAGLFRVLVCTIGSASTGVTLTAARHLVLNDLSWNSTDNDQAMKRIHRIGQDRKSFIHFMLKGKIDQMIKKKVIQKSLLLKELL